MMVHPFPWSLFFSSVLYADLGTPCPVSLRWSLAKFFGQGFVLQVVPQKIRAMLLILMIFSSDNLVGTVDHVFQLGLSLFFWPGLQNNPHLLLPINDFFPFESRRGELVIVPQPPPPPPVRIPPRLWAGSQSGSRTRAPECWSRRPHPKNNRNKKLS